MEIPDFVKTILRSAAPTLLTALGLPPPFSTIAASVVSGVLDKYLPEPAAPAADPAQPKPPLSPAQVKDIVQSNAGNPQLIFDLKKAEMELRQYEINAGIRFAEIEVEDRKRAGDFQQATGLALRTFNAGMTIVGIAIVGMFLMIAGSLYVALGKIELDPNKAQLTTAAFGLIGTAVGFINGIAATIVSFYYGSSQGSKEKSDVISAAVRNLGEGIERVAAREAVPYAGAPPADAAAQTAPIGASDALPLEPAKPADADTLREALDGLTKPHHLFPESVNWALQKQGIAIDGAAPQGTYGQPVTVGKIWTRYGEVCAANARTYGVPVELIVATIAAESSGDPNARRREPRVNDESVGLMQTLVQTARGALGRRTLKADDLLDPATSIAAGTAYIAQQRVQTHFDPPLVAAAYNAGSLRRDDGIKNRWRIYCYPAGTGQHIDRWIGWFNDCMLLSAKDGWGSGGTPSFAVALGAATGVARPFISKSGADYPPLPNFRPLKDTAARQALFGTFAYVLDPQPNNPEHIRITDGWDAHEIVNVTVSAGSVAGRPGPFAFPFNRRAAPQLQALWAEWEREGLFDRILTFDGSFVPRLIRGSKASLSCHAFGAAFDINAAFNPLNQMPPLAGKKGSVRELVEIANKHGFFWGGHFRTRLDGMHFEVSKLL